MSNLNAALNSQIKCQTCSIKRLCLPVMMADAEIEHLENIIQRKKILKKGEYLYHAGDKFEAIHAVRSGSLKSYTISSEGIEQITGFHLPGEILGLDSINSNEYTSFAKALETSLVCTLPFDKLETLARDIPGLQRQIFNVMSGEIREEQQLMMILNRKSADQRFASFIMNLSARFNRRGLSDNQFHLSMTRSDIANYLGLAVETVSRLVTKLQSQKLIKVQERHIEIINMPELGALAGTDCHPIQQ